jgi:hypothetical protein
MERPDEATVVLKQALKIDPVSPRAHYFDAMRSLDSTGVETLEKKMREVLELDPNFVPALQRYGKYQWQGHANIAAGIQIEEHAIALDPLNPWLRHIAQAMYLDIGDVDAARDVAAGTAQSAAAGQLLLSLYAGDWRGAGLASERGQPGWQYTPMENWGGPEALRDYALKTGKYASTISLLKEIYALDDNPQQNLNVTNFRAAVYVSQLIAAEGHRTQAEALRRTAEAWNDANEPKYGTLYARRLRAGIFLLDGRPEAALTELAASFHSGDYLQWWYTFKYDPVWEPLHNDPRFRAIGDQTARFASMQRAAVQTLRAQGLIPARGAGTGEGEVTKRP